MCTGAVRVYKILCRSFEDLPRIYIILPSDVLALYVDGVNTVRSTALRSLNAERYIFKGGNLSAPFSPGLGPVPTTLFFGRALP
jgi:hypothetical protein